jgi:exosome complex exonuclease RRP6
MDTHYLLYIYDKMRLDLVNVKNKDDNPVAFLKSVWKTSTAISLLTYEKPKSKDHEYFAIVQRNATLLGEGQMLVLQMLLTWRDYVGRVEDESTKYIMPNDVLFDIAKSTPRDFGELEQVLKRHFKHTHHESIIKYEEDLLQRINGIIKSVEDKIKQRVEENRKKTLKYDPYADSSSEEDSKVVKKSKKAAAKVPVLQNKPSQRSELKFSVEDFKPKSQVF